jgi:NhaP-type Na+/H+ or K+/H+ antiporter
MTADSFVATVALVGVVILVASLLSGLVERSALPQVAIILALGAALGPAGLGLVELTLGSTALQVIATLALVLVLFTDAISVDLGELRRRRALVAVVLGPGTLVSAAIVAVAAWLLLDLPPASAAILGAALASTDPVLCGRSSGAPSSRRTRGSPCGWRAG